MSDLVKRLRSGHTRSTETWPSLCEEAADRIEALEAQVKAADALAEVVPYRGQLIKPELVDALEAALAAYRAAKEGGV